jgi:hypothetical protein
VENGAEPEAFTSGWWFLAIDPQKGTPTVKIRHLVLCVVILAMSLGAVPTGASLAGAAPPSNDPATAAAYGARWLAARVTPDGFVPGPSSDPDPGDTLQTAVALAASGTDQGTFDRVVGWLSGHVDDVTGTGTDIDPGAIGYLMIVVAAAHADPTSFGGVDLETRLAGTLGAFEPGLYGSFAAVGDPTFSGVFTQSLAIIGLAASGAAEDPAALDWLSDQQCGGTDEFNGAWMSYRPRTDPSDPGSALVPCTAFDDNTFTGIDTNSTSIASEAMVAAHRTPDFDALSWLARNENADGSFGFFVGNDGDPDSDALAIQAIVAGGEDPTAGRWVKGSADPMTSLLSFQLGCDQAAADQGAFTFPGSGGATNALATEQGVWGAARATFPLGAVTFADAPTPCQVAPPPTAAPVATTPAPTADDPGAPTPVNGVVAFTG